MAVKLLDQVRQAIRMRHYSRRTEEAYVVWIRRYIVFHGKRHPTELGAPHIRDFLSSLATQRHVSASTQNQALCAVLFLYREVLRMDVGQVDGVVRASTPAGVPVVLSRAEVSAILARLEGAVWLVVALLYGAGMRLQEALELRVKDIDFERHQITVRQGKGRKDRVTCCRLRLRSGCVRIFQRSGINTRPIWLAESGARRCRTRSIESIPTQARSGRGNSCSPRGGFAGTRGGARRAGFICTSRLFSAPSRMRCGRHEFRRRPAVIRSGIRLRRTCLKTGLTSGPSRNCLGMQR
jgi:hypothetical protein